MAAYFNDYGVIIYNNIKYINICIGVKNFKNYVYTALWFCS